MFQEIPNLETDSDCLTQRGRLGTAKAARPTLVARLLSLIFPVLSTCELFHSLQLQ